MNRLDKKNFYQFPKYGFENILHENHFHPNQLKGRNRFHPSHIEP